MRESFEQELNSLNKKVRILEIVNFIFSLLFFITAIVIVILLIINWSDKTFFINKAINYSIYAVDIFFTFIFGIPMLIIEKKKRKIEQRIKELNSMLNDIKLRDQFSPKNIGDSSLS